MLQHRSSRRQIAPVMALLAAAVSLWALWPRWLDAPTAEEVAGVYGTGWWALMSGHDAPTNPPVLLMLANGLADGLDTIWAGRLLVMGAGLALAALVAWLATARAGVWAGLLTTLIIALTPPFQLAGARVRGYTLAALGLAVACWAWSRWMEEAPPQRRWRVVRVLATASVAYGHYLAMPLAVLLWLSMASTGPAARRYLWRDALVVGALWTPTLGWILGPGAAPLPAAEPAHRVMSAFLALSVQRPPSYHFEWMPWAEQVAPWLVTAALVAVGPLADPFARGLRRAALASMLCLGGLGLVLLVREPAAILLLPTVSLALSLAVFTVVWWRRLFPLSLAALWLGGAWRHLETWDDTLLSWDATELAEHLSAQTWAGHRVWIDDFSEFTRLDLINFGAPVSDASRDGRWPDCEDIGAGASLCRGVVPEGAPEIIRLPRTQPAPSGCEALDRGAGWAIVSCAP